MSTSASSTLDKTAGYAEWIITLVLLAVMIGAYALTFGWPSHTAFFPRLLSGFSIVLLVIKLAVMMWARFGAVAVPQAIPAPAEGTGEIRLITEHVDEDQGDEGEFHNIFVNADRRTWLHALGWLALFFVSLYLVGLLVTLPIFTVLYMRAVAKSSWTTCAVYVICTAGLIYLLFDRFLHLPLPWGVLPIFGE